MWTRDKTNQKHTLAGDKANQMRCWESNGTRNKQTHPLSLCHTNCSWEIHKPASRATPLEGNPMFLCSSESPWPLPKINQKLPKIYRQIALFHRRIAIFYRHRVEQKLENLEKKLYLCTNKRGKPRNALQGKASCTLGLCWLGNRAEGSRDTSPNLWHAATTNLSAGR